VPLSIDMEIEIDAPIGRVWQAVSTQEGLRGWFSPVIEIDPRIGGWVEFHGTHGSMPYRFGGRIVELKAPTRITWEWNSLLEDWPAPTLLTIELFDQGTQTRVEMRHHGWEALGEPLAAREHRDFTRGWGMSNELRDLKEYVENSRVVVP
jgi:uncharacterized protein YndB with AHSA1/START domain